MYAPSEPRFPSGCLMASPFPFWKTGMYVLSEDPNLSSYTIQTNVHSVYDTFDKALHALHYLNVRKLCLPRSS